ncbi:MAG TPA: RNA polymerase sigma factor [Vicinamibacterales bacterium]|nr:RNA polymerase sigma factor [Vicinamibacterales bacterium]
MTVSDVERLSVVAEGDTALAMTEEAFRSFYDRTSRALWGYLARLTGDPSLADDLLQDTYYRFLRAGAAHESEAHRRNSLFKIATNLARDAARRRRVLPFFVGDDAAEIPSREDVAGRVQRTTDVGRALETMKPRERAMLWLAYAEGSSHQEIASVLGVKTASVKLLLFRARRRLAGILGRVPEAAPKGGA